MAGVAELPMRRGTLGERLEGLGPAEAAVAIQGLVQAALPMSVYFTFTLLPPSTGKATPVMKPASSDARNSAA